MFFFCFIESVLISRFYKSNTPHFESQNNSHFLLMASEKKSITNRLPYLINVAVFYIHSLCAIFRVDKILNCTGSLQKRFFKIGLVFYSMLCNLAPLVLVYAHKQRKRKKIYEKICTRRMTRPCSNDELDLAGLLNFLFSAHKKTMLDPKCLWKPCARSKIPMKRLLLISRKLDCAILAKSLPTRSFKSLHNSIPKLGNDIDF